MPRDLQTALESPPKKYFLEIGKNPKIALDKS
nr:MAG TPA: hypothetical protein [Caudoviricetes sp.]